MVVFAYFSAIVIANLAVLEFGPWISVLNSFFLIGLDLVLRDVLHDRWKGKKLWVKMLLLISFSGLLSYAINKDSGQIALASSVAFMLSGITGAVIYSIYSRLRFIARSNLSNAPAALVDSVAFPFIAFGSIMPEIVIAHFLAKVSGGFFWSFIVERFKK